MPKLITKFKYLKPTRRQSIGNYAKYIATRDGVELLDNSQKYAPATEKQQELIYKLLRDFPDCQDMFEYQDYRQSHTVAAASDFINRAIEDHSGDIAGRKGYAKYIGTRARVERIGSHGLFTDNGVQVQLTKVAKELDQHQGNVWTVIISLRREDAQRLGFDSGKRWRDMLRTQTESLATSLKIPMNHLKWYAAFHNESHHPHVHMIVYSTQPDEGFLTRQGVNNLRSSLARDIFAQDLLSVYEVQTEYRDELRSVSRKRIADLVAGISFDNCDHRRIQELLLQLAQRLSRTSGKKVYGYLKADVKDIVDTIVDELAKEPHLKELYDLWYKQREAVLRTYTDTMPPRVPLSQNKEFKSIRNAVIQQAMELVGQEEASELNCSGIIQLLESLGRLLQDRIQTEQKKLPHVDRKEQQTIAEKKQAHGQRME